MRLPILSLTCASLIGVSSALPAADTSIQDLRLNLGFSLTDDGEFWVGDQSFDFDSDSWFIAGQYMRSMHPLQSWGGLIIGGELFFSSTTGDFPAQPGNKMDITTYGIQGYYGYAYALPTAPLHLELTPFLGIGQAKTKLYDNTLALEDNDTLVQYGLRAASYYTFVNRVQAGLELRYIIDSTTKPILDETPTEGEQAGLSVVLSTGHRF